MKPIVENVLKTVRNVQEMKTIQDFRPANQQELGIAMAHAMRMGVTVAENDIKIDESGWIIISYVDSNDEQAQMRVNPHGWEAMNSEEDYEDPQDAVAEECGPKMTKKNKKETIQKNVIDEEDQLDEKFKVGDMVSVARGPMKHKAHEIIAVNADGSYNVKPQVMRASENRYRLGAAKALKADLKMYVAKEIKESTSIDDYTNLIWKVKDGKLVRESQDDYMMQSQQMASNRSSNKSPAEKKAAVDRAKKEDQRRRQQREELLAKLTGETVTETVYKCVDENWVFPDQLEELDESLKGTDSNPLVNLYSDTNGKKMVGHVTLDTAAKIHNFSFTKAINDLEKNATAKKNTVVQVAKGVYADISVHNPKHTVWKW